MQEVKIEKPIEPISSPQKFIAGVLCLVFGLLFSLTLIERLTIMAPLFAVPFVICLIFFMYKWMIDIKILRKYKDYRDGLLIIVREKKLQYETKGELISNASPKNIIVALASFMLIAAIVLMGRGRALSLIAIVLFIIFFGAYIYFESEEGKTVVREIEKLETILKEGYNEPEE